MLSHGDNLFQLLPLSLLYQILPLRLQKFLMNFKYRVPGSPMKHTFTLMEVIPRFLDFFLLYTEESCSQVTVSNARRQISYIMRLEGSESWNVSQ